MTSTTHYNVQVTIQEVVVDTIADTDRSANRGDMIRTKRDPIEVLRVNTRGTSLETTFQEAFKATSRAMGMLETELEANRGTNAV